jgi:dCMP deaminase
MLHAHLAATRSTCNRGPELLFDPGRHGVGCVIVKDKRIIGGGYNGSPPKMPHCNTVVCGNCGFLFGYQDISGDLNSHLLRKNNEETCPKCDKNNWKLNHLMRDGHCVRTTHSETNAILQCALHGVSPEGADVYTTASPCYDCTKLLCGAKVSNIFFGESYDSRYGLSEDALELLKVAGIPCKRVKMVLVDSRVMKRGV